MNDLEIYEKVWWIDESIPRRGEGDMIELKDGSLLLTYTQFYGGSSDHSSARVVGRISRDRGINWEDGFVLQPNTGDMNVMSVSLERLHSGDMALLYLVKNSQQDCRAYFRKSDDEGGSWSEAVCATPQKGYHVVNNDRLVQLSDGRLIVPACTYPERSGGANWSTVFYSDDRGESWEPSDSRLQVEGSESGMQEPGVVELKDGSLLMFMRCDLGYIYQSRSLDGGETWSAPGPTELEAPVSPVSIKRIPSTRDLLVIWNDRSQRTDGEPFSRRTPLTSAISRDEGKSWGGVKNIESDHSRTYCYTSVTFVDGRVYLTYYISEPRENGERVLASLKLKVLESDWFYVDQTTG